MSTLEFLSKKHLKFDQGLDFLKSSEGNRFKNEGNRREIQEKVWKTKEISIKKIEIESLLSFLKNYYSKKQCICLLHEKLIFMITLQEREAVPIHVEARALACFTKRLSHPPFP